MSKEKRASFVEERIESAAEMAGQVNQTERVGTVEKN
jgi:hypothetical protein